MPTKRKCKPFTPKTSQVRNTWATAASEGNVVMLAVRGTKGEGALLALSPIEALRLAERMITVSLACLPIPTTPSRR